MTRCMLYNKGYWRGPTLWGGVRQVIGKKRKERKITVKRCLTAISNHTIQHFPKDNLDYT